MFAVITERRLTYLGNCQDQALAAFNARPGSTLHSIESQDELKDLLCVEPDCTEDPLSAGFKQLVGKLDQLGVNQDLPGKIRDNSVKLVGEAKSLGVKGMKVVGEGFVALGELLRKASAEGEESEKSTKKNGPPKDHDIGGES